MIASAITSLLGRGANFMPAHIATSRHHKQSQRQVLSSLALLLVTPDSCCVL